MVNNQINVEKVNAMANILMAMKDTFYPDRTEKDSIVAAASSIIRTELAKENPASALNYSEVL